MIGMTQLLRACFARWDVHDQARAQRLTTAKIGPIFSITVGPNI